MSEAELRALVQRVGALESEVGLLKVAVHQATRKAEKATADLSALQQQLVKQGFAKKVGPDLP